jgi:hypothetical protein
MLHCSVDDGGLAPKCRDPASANQLSYDNVQKIVAQHSTGEASPGSMEAPVVAHFPNSGLKKKPGKPLTA